MKTASTHITPSGWLMILLLFSLGAINFADKAVLGLASISIIKDLHLSAAQYGLVSGSFFLLFALSSVLVTAWSDWIGTKKVLGLLATSWAIIQIATVFVFSFPALLLTRIVLGAGEGPSYGTSVSAATPWLPADRKTFGLGIVTMGSVVGPAIFAPILTFLIVVGGWRSAFAFLGGIGLLWVILWLLLGREHAVAGHTSVPEKQLENSRTHWSRLLPFIFSHTVLSSIVAAFVVYWASALYLSWNPVYLINVRHLALSDPLYIAGITLPYLVGGIVLLAFSAFADRIFRQTGSQRRSYVYTVTALLIVSALCLYLAVSVPSALGSVIFFTLAPIGVSVPILSTIITAVAPEAHRGTILGIVVAISTLPGLIAPLLSGLIIQLAGKNIVSGFHIAYLFASLLLLIGAVTFLVFARPDEEQLKVKIHEGAAQVQS